jgi:hypothetical protein
MSETTEYRFERKSDFLDKLARLLDDGVAPERLQLVTPFHVHEVERLLGQPASRLRIFSLAGALIGFALGWALTILTALDWPIVTGGKPIVSIPAYLVVVFELTILLGALASLIGFLLLARVPDLARIRTPIEHDNAFVIRVQESRR